MTNHSQLPGGLKPAAQTGKTLGAGCAVLFAIPFFAAGMACLLGAMWSYWKAYQGRSWVEVPAAFEKPAVEADPREPKRGEKPTYRYHWEGRTYYNDRVSVGFGSDDENQQAKSKNRTAAVAREEISCFVNPANPQEAALSRPKASLAAMFLGIFALSHGGVGLTILIGSIAQLRKARRKKQIMDQFPTEPWNWREDWAASTSTPTFRVSRWVWTYVGAVWFLISWIGFALLLTEPLATQTEKLWAFVIAAVGVIPIRLAWRKWRSHLAYRAAAVEFSSTPLRPGETVRVVLLAPESLLMDPALPQRLRLRCMKRTSEGTGKSRRTSDTAVWQDSEETRIEDFMRSVEGNARCTAILTIPKRAATTAIEPDEVGIRWELALLDDSGKSLVEFPLPVFQTTQAPNPSASIAEDAADTDDDDNDDEGVDEHSNWSTEETKRRFGLEQIQIREESDAKCYHFPPRRHSMPATVMAIIAIGFAVLGVVPLFLKVPFFFIIWAVIVAGVTWMALRLNFQQVTIRVNQHGMEILRQMPWQGTPGRKFFPCGQIQGVSVSSSNAEYNGTPFYTVQVTLQDGKSKGITPEFADFSTAWAFAEQMEAALGIAKRMDT
jgi:hypothetical protein